MEQKHKEWLNYLPLIAVIIVIFYLVNPLFFQHTFYPSSPSNLLANDAYAHLAYINDVIEVGNYNHESQFYVGFSGDQVSPREPPLMLFYVAFIKNYLGIPSYAAAQFGLLLGIVLAISILYVLIKKYSLSWALGFLPATLFLFTFPFIAGITWGFWKAYFMYFILATALIFFLTELNKSRAALLVVVLSALILASPALLMFFLFLLFLKLLLEWPKLKQNFFTLLVTGLVTLTITIHYFLNYSVARTEGGTETKFLETLGIIGHYNLYAANPYASHFGWVWYIALIGFAYGIFWLVQNFKEKESYKYRLFTLSSYFFAIFLLPAVGITRIYQFRLVWPLFLALSVGLVIYLLVTLLKKKVAVSGTLLAAGISLVLFLILFFTLSFPTTNYSITSPEQWEAYTYLHDQTPKDATLLLIDPIMSQNSVALMANRKIHYFDAERFAKMVAENKTLLNYPSWYYCAYPEKSREGFKIYSTLDLKKKCEDAREKIVPLCAFDYLFMNKQFSSQQQIPLVQEFLSSINQSNWEKIKDSQQVLLLKNNKVCVGEF